MRFLKIIGNGRDIVANPHASNSEPRRYAGYRQRADQSAAVVQATFGIASASVLARYEPVEETLADDPALRKATLRGELRMIAEGVGDRANISWKQAVSAPAPRKEN